MYIDARFAPQGAEIEADVCIIGAGAAGITLGLEFKNVEFKTIILESGGEDYDEDTQRLTNGRNVGLAYFDLSVARLRYFGGTTNHWAGWCRPLDPLDLEHRPWIPHSGWPISRTDLDPYYDRAWSICQLESNDFTSDGWRRGSNSSRRHILPLVNTGLQTGIYQHSPPTRYGKVYGPDLQKSESIRIFFYANVVNLETTHDVNKVTKVNVTTLSGTRFTVRAKLFVLATGGLENARILLLSNTIAPKGLGNQYDLVGRFFMEHVNLFSGFVYFSRAIEPYSWYIPGTDTVTAHLQVSPDAQKQEQIANYYATLHSGVDLAELSEGFGSLRRVVRSVQNGEIPRFPLEDLGNIIRDFDDLLSYAYHRAIGEDMAANILVIQNNGEQTPNSDSRVMLDSETDALGLNRIKLDWRMNDIDKRSIYIGQRLIGRAFGQAALGRVNLGVGPDEASPWSVLLQGGFHHMGTTRMSDDPKQGVVDRNCKVHGMDNLYVAGSSVFPTAGAAPPTFTITALAIRLADHIKTRKI